MLVIVTLAACRTPVGVDRIGGRDAHREVGINALNDDDPKDALAQLHRIARESSGSDVLRTLAELSFLKAEQTNDDSLFLACAVYAWWYLSGEESVGARQPYDIGFRMSAKIKIDGRGMGQRSTCLPLRIASRVTN